jgi:hypothetical protein
MPARSARKLQLISEAGARRVFKLGADSATTIVARTPLMSDPGSAANRDEMTRMVMEKAPAFAEATMRLAGRGPAMNLPLQRFVGDQFKLNYDLLAQTMRVSNPTGTAVAQQAWLAGSTKLVLRLGLELSASSLAGFSAALVPIHREARANARRLVRRK